MTTINLDTRGLRNPVTLFMIAARVSGLSDGDILEVVGDSPTFEEDLSIWCLEMKKTLIVLDRDGEVVTAEIRC